MIWRVGDGIRIKIWKDKWLPTQISQCVQSPIKNLPSDSKVQQLIDIETMLWKKGPVYDILLKLKLKPSTLL